MDKELLALVQELFKMDQTHEEINLNGKSLVVDAKKEGDNKLVVTLVLNEKKDKKEFEKWLDKLDDNLFEEVWESLSAKHGLKKLNEEYESGDYKSIINLFKNEAKNIALKKIDYLTKTFGL